MNLKKILIITICALLTISFVACDKNDQDTDQEVTKDAFKMNTYMTIKAYGAKASDAIDAAFARIDEIEQLTSATIETSDISKINQSAGKKYVNIHPDTLKIIKYAVKYSELSDGAFDITVGPLIKLWGIGTENQRVPSDSEIKEALALVGYKNILINEADQSVKLAKEGMSIDLGGIAKGFAADEVIKVFKTYEIERAIISLGGSTIYTIGQKPDGSLWSIGIQHPREARNEALTCTIMMPQQALSTSGDYERFFTQDDKRYHHILDPHTGSPADSGVMSDTVVVDSNIADCNLIADILTKLTFVSGVEQGFKIIDSIPGVACIAQTTDFKIYKSTNWDLQLKDISPDFTLVN